MERVGSGPNRQKSSGSPDKAAPTDPSFTLWLWRFVLFTRSVWLRLFSWRLSLQRRKCQYQPVIEQIGTYDPIPNEHNEKLVSFNFERVRYWLGSGAHLSTPVAELLGNTRQPNLLVQFNAIWSLNLQVLPVYFRSIPEPTWTPGETDKRQRRWHSWRRPRSNPKMPQKLVVRTET